MNLEGLELLTQKARLKFILVAKYLGFLFLQLTSNSLCRELVLLCIQVPSKSNHPSYGISTEMLQPKVHTDRAPLTVYAEDGLKERVNRNAQQRFF